MSFTDKNHWSTSVGCIKYFGNLDKGLMAMLTFHYSDMGRKKEWRGINSGKMIKQ